MLKVDVSRLRRSLALGYDEQTSEYQEKAARSFIRLSRELEEVFGDQPVTLEEASKRGLSGMVSASLKHDADTVADLLSDPKARRAFAMEAL